MAFLPTRKKDCDDLGWERPDFVLITGDGYVDHPSFGAALIGRLLSCHGYKVAVLAQPDYHSADDFRRFGEPRLAFLVTGGNVDSMVNHFSVTKIRRKRDEYAPGGKPGKRPDRAVIVYSNRAREAFKGVPVILGGLEASLRRFGHYDYWDDRVRRSVLLDAKADLLVYGMGERAILEIAEALESGIAVKDITWIKGTCYAGALPEPSEEIVLLPSYEKISENSRVYAESFALQYQNCDAITGKPLAEGYGQGRFVVQNPPQPVLEREELDEIYDLPFEGTYPPEYEAEGGIPAISEVSMSITANRGCFGGCSFCALTYHQGREVRSRSKESILTEARKLTARKDFKGYIHDVGGPTANFCGPACEKQVRQGVCRDKDCMYPRICPVIKPDHSEYLSVLRSLRELPGVKKVFVRSGIRFDYLLADPDETFFRELVAHHISGTLKVAPEHVSGHALSAMRKPGIKTYEAFRKKYEALCAAQGKKQFLIPYFISSHPGTRLADAATLAVYLHQSGFVPDQVQDFYPTPGTLATCMYHTELDPLTMKPVYVAKSQEEKRMQRALIHFHKPENRKLAEKALKAAGREDLIPVLLQRRKKK